MMMMRSSVASVRNIYSSKSNVFPTLSQASKQTKFFKSTLSSELVENEVTLKNIPALPILGSLIPQYSKIPARDSRKVYDYHPTIRKKYGEFYSIGLPGIGVGLYGTVYLLSDPTEMLKVLRHEGTYPFGAILTEWPLIKLYKEKGSSLHGLFSQGEEWKRLRSFMQTDLLNPHAAKGYVPGIVKAAENISKNLPQDYDTTMKEYLSRCSFDIFSTVMFGELVTSEVDENAAENKLLCKTTLGVVDDLFAAMMSPTELILSKIGIDTTLYTSMKNNLDACEEIALKKIEAFKKRKAEGKLNEIEKASYLSRAIDRQKEGSNITENEMKELSMILLLSAVDTTSSLLHWILVHLALNQDVQQNLHDVLQDTVKQYDGHLCADALSKKSIPYLHAVIRENHRLTPSVSISIIKSISSEVEVHGAKLPAGSRVAFSAYATGMDPDIVSEPHKFDPTRWLVDAVEARQGTKAQVIDHALLKDPFSVGARKCPGSRVASYEVLVLIAQLVLDWKISIDDERIKSLKDVTYNQQLTIHPDPLNFQFSPRK